MMPSSAALQKVLGHMGAVAMRLTLLVWSENIWMVSFTVRSCTWTFVSAAPVTKILSPEWGRNCVDTKHQMELISTDTMFHNGFSFKHITEGTQRILNRSIHWYSHFYAMDHSLINGFKFHLCIITSSVWPHSQAFSWSTSGMYLWQFLCADCIKTRPWTASTLSNEYTDDFQSNNKPLIKWPTVPPNVQRVNLYHRKHLFMTKKGGAEQSVLQAEHFCIWHPEFYILKLQYDLIISMYVNATTVNDFRFPSCLLMHPS